MIIVQVIQKNIVITSSALSAPINLTAVIFQTPQFAKLEIVFNVTQVLNVDRILIHAIYWLMCVIVVQTLRAVETLHFVFQVFANNAEMVLIVRIQIRNVYLEPANNVP